MTKAAKNKRDINAASPRSKGARRSGVSRFALEPPCPIQDRRLKSEIKRMLAEAAHALRNTVGGWNFNVQVARQEGKARPDAELFESDDPEVQAWCDWWWRRAMWGAGR